MEESTFPYRVDERTRTFLADVVGIMQRNNVRFSMAGGTSQVQFLEKGQNSTTIDAPLNFTQEGAQMLLPMNAVAKTNSGAMSWLREYQNFLNRSRNEELTPVPQRCSVLVEARVDGTLKYYMSYMVVHQDGSLAQDMPQGRLYATEALLASPASQPTAGQQAASQQAEPASWLTEDDD